MSDWNLLTAGLSALSESRLQIVKRAVHAIQYRAGIAIIDRRTIAIMRDYLFDLSCDLQIITEKIEQSPQQACFVAKLIEARLIQSGLKSELFPDVDEKAYFVQIKNDVQKAIESAKQRLDNETRLTIDTAVQYALNLPLLTRAMKAKEAQAYLEMTESHFQTLNKQSSRRTTFLTLGILSLIVNLVGTFVIFVVIGPAAVFGYLLAIEESLITNNTNQTIIAVLIIIGVLVVLAWAISILFLVLGLRKNPEFAKLFRIREVAKKDLLSNAEWLDVKQRIGIFSADEYQRLFQEYQNTLSPYLGIDLEDSLINSFL